jgi:hypothetical protein
VLASELGLKMLGLCKAIGSDGTFFSCPLLNDYKRVINCVKVGTNKYNIKLDPNIIMTDFEKGAFNAFEFEFPGANCKGCYFPFSQCLYRKLCDYGLKVHYENDKR